MKCFEKNIINDLKKDDIVCNFETTGYMPQKDKIFLFNFITTEKIITHINSKIEDEIELLKIFQKYTSGKNVIFLNINSFQINFLKKRFEKSKLFLQKNSIFDLFDFLKSNRCFIEFKKLNYSYLLNFYNLKTDFSDKEMLTAYSNSNFYNSDKIVEYTENKTILCLKIFNYVKSILKISEINNLKQYKLKKSEIEKDFINLVFENHKNENNQNFQIKEKYCEINCENNVLVVKIQIIKGKVTPDKKGYCTILTIPFHNYEVFNPYSLKNNLLYLGDENLFNLKNIMIYINLILKRNENVIFKT